MAPSFVEGTGITKMQDAIEFKDVSFTQVGKKIIDLLVIQNIGKYKENKKLLICSDKWIAERSDEE